MGRPSAKRCSTRLACGPSLERHYPASSVVRASKPPCRPGLTLAAFRSMRARHQQGFSCCHVFHLAGMPTPVPRRKRSVLLSFSFRDRHRPSPVQRRVGSRDCRIAACTAFATVPACLLVEPPQGGPLKPGCFNLHHYLCKSSWLLATDATSVGWDSHPPGKRAFPRRTLNLG